MKRMKKKEVPHQDITKETPDERKKRVSSGIKYRPSVFEDKRKKREKKKIDKYDYE